MLLCAMALSVISLYASEYKSMIRYDRVWECICLYDEDGEAVLKCIKFDGPEEINGKVYHKLVTFKKTFLKYHIDTETTTYETIDCLEPVGYMREEDGIVYTLIAERQVDTYLNGEPSYEGEPYTSAEEDSDEIICKEEVIYNFNVEEEDSYSSVSFIHSFGSGLFSFRVLNLSTIEVAGEECRMMYVCTEDKVEYQKNNDIPYYWNEPIVEGIGAVGKGCLNYHEFYDIPSRMYSHHYFCRLFDMDGKVIYPLDYKSTPDDLDYGSFSSVEGISSSIYPKDTLMYDMLGRRISSPAPGQLYIQGGKKMIAPQY